MPDNNTFDSDLLFFKYRSRNNSGTVNNPRKIFLSFNSEDYARYFDIIVDDLLKYQDCIIYYDENNKADAFENDEIYQCFESINLFVFIITNHLLSAPCRNVQISLKYAQDNNVPILPIMVENSSREQFKEKFGSIQYLNKYKIDETALKYEDKLESYLSAVLINDELTQKVREAFDTHIFLSYRKKDRKYANRLIKLIHNFDEYFDTAIWYDEFLNPGENYNDAIDEQLINSDLFLLTVTPNLINEKNYVANIEYPNALKNDKSILPVESVPTDREQLEEFFKNIPQCIDPENDTELNSSLFQILKNKAVTENGSSPEHLFFIGLAYLNGISVEKNTYKGVKLIREAAENGLIEASDMLANIYYNGIGVIDDYILFIHWSLQSAKYRRKKYEEEHTLSSAMDYIKHVLELDDVLYTCSFLWMDRIGLGFVDDTDIYDVHWQIVHDCDDIYKDFLTDEVLEYKAKLCFIAERFFLDKENCYNRHWYYWKYDHKAEKIYRQLYKKTSDPCYLDALSRVCEKMSRRFYELIVDNRAIFENEWDRFYTEKNNKWGRAFSKSYYEKAMEAAKAFQIAQASQFNNGSSMGNEVNNDKRFYYIHEDWNYEETIMKEEKFENSEIIFRDKQPMRRDKQKDIQSGSTSNENDTACTKLQNMNKEWRIKYEQAVKECTHDASPAEKLRLANVVTDFLGDVIDEKDFDIYKFEEELTWALQIYEELYNNEPSEETMNMLTSAYKLIAFPNVNTILIRTRFKKSKSFFDKLLSIYQNSINCYKEETMLHSAQLCEEMCCYIKSVDPASLKKLFSEDSDDDFFIEPEEYKKTELNEYLKKSEIIYRQSAKKYKTYKSRIVFANFLERRAHELGEENKYAESMEYADEALQIYMDYLNEESNDQYLFKVCESVLFIAYIYHDVDNDYSKGKNKKSSLEYFMKAISILNSCKDKSTDQYNSKMSDIYMKIGMMTEGTPELYDPVEAYKQALSYDIFNCIAEIKLDDYLFEHGRNEERIALLKEFEDERKKSSSSCDA